MRLWPAIMLMMACGRGSGTAAGPLREDGGPKAAHVEASATVAPLALGMSAVTAFGYRKGPGQPGFRRARESEAAGKWTEVAAACREALAADPAHLDAAYLWSVALAKTGAPPAQIVAPLTVAVAGDFIKWGAAALVQPALQPFLATPIGTAWQARVIEARAQHGAILSRSLVIGSNGDYYAYDRDAARFHRLTRTGGAVVATFRAHNVTKLLYVTRERRKGAIELGIGLVDLARSRSKKLAYVQPSDTIRDAIRDTIRDTIRVAYSTKRDAFIVRSKTWFIVEDGGDALQLHAMPAKENTSFAERSWVDVTGRRAKLGRGLMPSIAADVDAGGLASALKIQSSKRVVTVPSPGLIDTHTIAWSPDRSQFAFIALHSEVCRSGANPAAVFVADAATGTAREIERSVRAMAFDWVADRTLAIIGDHGVAIHTLAGDVAPLVIEGADALAPPSRSPVCAAETLPSDDSVAEPEDDL